MSVGRVVGAGLLAAGLWGCGCAGHQGQPVPAIDWPEGDPVAGREAFLSAGCPECHAVAGVDDLDDVADTVVILGQPGPSIPTRERLFECIINPSRHTSLRYLSEDAQGHAAPGMPDFSSLTVRELIDIVAFLEQAYVSGG